MKYYLIGIYSDGLVCPIGTEGGTMADADSRLKWQTQGGFNRDDYRVCHPHTFAEGVMCCRGTGEHFRITRGALTEKAFAEMLDSIWGPEGDIAKALAPPRFYLCGTCEHYHRVGFNDDCRDDAQRFTAETLESIYGPDILDSVIGEGL